METVSAGVAGTEAAEVAAVAGVASLESGAAEELAGCAPAPNCPARKTWAALASFDLMSWAGAGLGWAGDWTDDDDPADVDGDVAETDDGGTVDGETDDADGVADDAATEGDVNALLVTAAGAALPPLLIRTLTAKLPLHSGAACAFTPKKRWPGTSTLSRRVLPTGIASPCACSLAISDPTGAAATGRLALASVEPLAPRGSQGAAEDVSVPAAAGAGAALISIESPACRSTPVSVQGCVVEMVKE